MKKQCTIYIFTTLLILIISSTLYAQEKKWVIDRNHSNVTFEISYFGIGTVKGGFDDFKGQLIMADEALSEAKFSIEIQAASINTNQQKRDEHLKSKDFFNVAAQPLITFESRSVKKESENNYLVLGDLSMGGISKEITLKITNKGSFFHPRFQKTVLVLEVAGIVLRESHQVGTNYGPASKALGNEVALKAQIHLSPEADQ